MRKLVVIIVVIIPLLYSCCISYNLIRMIINHLNKFQNLEIIQTNSPWIGLKTEIKIINRLFRVENFLGDWEQNSKRATIKN